MTTFSPLHTLYLAAQCCGLKALLIEQQTKVTGLEERQREADAQHGRDAARIAELLRRNQELTRAVQRTACAG